MRLYSYYIGIDVSKKTLDFTLIDFEGEILSEGKIINEPAKIKEWILSLKSHGLNLAKEGEILLCLEHSGYYGAPLLRTLHEHSNIAIWMESALRIKRSMGLQRGKSDRLDARRIATYSIDFQRYAKLWQPSTKSIERLGLLLSHRDRMVKTLMSIRNSLKEEIGYVDKELHEEMQLISNSPIQKMDAAVKEFDSRIEALLESDVKLSRQLKIIRSIPGFGPVIAPKLIEVTRGFTRLSDAKQLACFAGVAPFEHSSGTSIKGRTRVSHLANKDIKKMLHLAALVTIRKGNIMRAYFDRKVLEGKHKMAIINAIRNKLLHILMACIKNDTMYQKNYSHKLA